MDVPTANQAFEIRRIVVAPGAERPYDESEWEDALVVIESGELELEYRGGDRTRFDRGDVLWLIGLPLRVLRNHGAVPTVLVAVTRPRTARTGHFDSGEMTRA
jgi:mannose-6-phosphate isomerase-like protein (cupin superfamily)